MVISTLTYILEPKYSTLFYIDIYIYILLTLHATLPWLYVP